MIEKLHIHQPCPLCGGKLDFNTTGMYLYCTRCTLNTSGTMLVIDKNGKLWPTR